MSILPVLPLVQAYNADKRSLFATTEKYELTQEDNKRLITIFTAIQLIKPPYEVVLKVCGFSGQLYLQCKEKPLKLPAIR